MDGGGHCATRFRTQLELWHRLRRATWPLANSSASIPTCETMRRPQPKQCNHLAPKQKRSFRRRRGRGVRMRVHMRLNDSAVCAVIIPRSFSLSRSTWSFHHHHRVFPHVAPSLSQSHRAWQMCVLTWHIWLSTSRTGTSDTYLIHARNTAKAIQALPCRPFIQDCL